MTAGASYAASTGPVTARRRGWRAPRLALRLRSLRPGWRGERLPGGEATLFEAPVTGAATLIGLCAERRVAQLVDAGQDAGTIATQANGGPKKPCSDSEDGPPPASLKDLGVQSGRLSEARLIEQSFTDEDLKARAAEATAKGQPLRGVREAWTPTSASLLAGLARCAAHSTAQRRAHQCVPGRRPPMSSSATAAADGHGTPPPGVSSARGATPPTPSAMGTRAEPAKESLSFLYAGSGFLILSRCPR
jgi:hypothetical protein